MSDIYIEKYKEFVIAIAPYLGNLSLGELKRLKSEIIEIGLDVELSDILSEIIKKIENLEFLDNLDKVEDDTPTFKI